VCKAWKLLKPENLQFSSAENVVSPPRRKVSHEIQNGGSEKAASSLKINFHGDARSD
jgi:hypothetical protein